MERNLKKEFLDQLITDELLKELLPKAKEEIESANKDCTIFEINPLSNVEFRGYQVFLKAGQSKVEFHPMLNPVFQIDFENRLIEALAPVESLGVFQDHLTSLNLGDTDSE
ncbi:MAG: hypothetical protein R8G66_06420 [Cytophagales bacterium]|nr:hypothetical protein [Cytophagales bacterium]